MIAIVVFTLLDTWYRNTQGLFLSQVRFYHLQNLRQRTIRFMIWKLSKRTACPVHCDELWNPITFFTGFFFRTQHWQPPELACCRAVAESRGLQDIPPTEIWAGCPQQTVLTSCSLNSCSLTCSPDCLHKYNHCTFGCKHIYWLLSVTHSDAVNVWEFKMCYISHSRLST